MAIQKWKKLSSKEILNHPRLHVVEDRVELPNGKSTDYVLFDSGHGSATVIAVNNKNEILIQKEYSYPPNEVLWQLPGGGIEKDEEVIAAARRELAEESNLTAESWEIIGSYYTNNRRSKVKQHVVLARGLTELQLDGDDEEFIENYWLSENTIKEMLANDVFDNAFLIAALSLYFFRKGAFASEK